MERSRIASFKCRGPTGEIKRMLKAERERSRRKSGRDDAVMRRRALQHSPLAQIQEEASAPKSSGNVKEEETKKLLERLSQWKEKKKVEKQQRAMEKARHKPFVLVSRSNVIPRTPPVLPKVSRRKPTVGPEPILRRSARIMARESAQSEEETSSKAMRGKGRGQKTSKIKEQKVINKKNSQVTVTSHTQSVPQSFDNQLETALNSLSVVDFSQPKSFSPFQFSFQPSNEGIAAVNPYKEKSNDQQLHDIPKIDSSFVTITRSATCDVASAASPWFKELSGINDKDTHWWEPDLKQETTGSNNGATALLKEDACNAVPDSNWIEGKRLVVAPFRQLIESETQRLESLCYRWNQIMAQEDLQEEGMISAAVGKAQLLIGQRFRQFEQLCDVAEDPSAVNTAEASDLQGFWDMIHQQVIDVNSQFEELIRLQQNNWEIEEKATFQKQGKRRTKKKKVETASTTDTIRRQQMQKFKSKMLAAKKFASNDVPVEIMGAGQTVLNTSYTNTDKTTPNLEVNRRYSLRRSVLMSATKLNLSEVQGDVDHVMSSDSTPPALNPKFNMLDYTIPSRLGTTESSVSPNFSSGH